MHHAIEKHFGKTSTSPCEEDKQHKRQIIDIDQSDSDKVIQRPIDKSLVIDHDMHTCVVHAIDGDDSDSDSDSPSDPD